MRDVVEQRMHAHTAGSESAARTAKNTTASSVQCRLDCSIDTISVGHRRRGFAWSCSYTVRRYEGRRLHRPAAWVRSARLYTRWDVELHCILEIKNVYLYIVPCRYQIHTQYERYEQRVRVTHARTYVCLTSRMKISNLCAVHPRGVKRLLWGEHGPRCGGLKSHEWFSPALLTILTATRE